jgi:hypothetical protein
MGAGIGGNPSQLRARTRLSCEIEHVSAGKRSQSGITSGQQPAEGDEHGCDPEEDPDDHGDNAAGEIIVFARPG